MPVIHPGKPAENIGQKTSIHPYWLMKLSRSQVLLRLQRPFPLISIFLPGRSVFSNNSTSAPDSAARLPPSFRLLRPITITFSGLSYF